MLFPAIDMEHRQVTDIMLGGDAANLYQELIHFYNMLTGEGRKGFNSLDEAKKMCVEAAHRRYFGSEVFRPPQPIPQPTQPQVGQPAPQPVPAPQPQKAGPTPPWARGPEAGNGGNQPTAQPAAPTPQVQVQPQAQPTPTQTPNRSGTGPVALARKVFDEMAGAPRKDVIEACARLGIKRSTAQTQYQAWKKAREEAAVTRNPQGMPQLPPGSYVGSAPTQH